MFSSMESIGRVPWGAPKAARYDVSASASPLADEVVLAAEASRSFGTQM
jgi:hypothetical protein